MVFWLSIGLLDQWIVRPTFQELEQTQALEDGERASKAIRNELRQLGNEIGNWAAWDDAYAFAADANPAFIRSNFGDWAALERSSHLNFAAMLDQQGQVLYSGGYDTDLGGTFHLNAFNGTRSAIWPQLQPIVAKRSSLDGLLATEHGLLLFVARPILTTRGSGPVRGVLIFGRFLDSALLQLLREQTKVAFELFAADDPRLTPPEQHALHTLSPRQTALLPGPDGIHFVYERLEDVEGQPAALLRTTIREDISKTAQNTSRTLMTVLGLTTLMVLVIGVWIFSRAAHAINVSANTGVWVIAVITAVIGLSLTGVIFFQLREHSQEALERRFQSLAMERAGVIAEKLGGSLRELDAVRRFFNHSGTISRDEFSRFVAPILNYYHFQALEWVPRVSRDQRAAFETTARQEGYPTFQFTESDNTGRLVPTSEQDEYFPVYYLEPYAGNEIALGFNPDITHPTRGTLLTAARDSGHITLSGRYVLVQETALPHFSVLAFAPVYATGQTPPTLEERRKLLKGFIVGIIRVGSFVENTFAANPPTDLVIAFKDISAPPPQQLLYTWYPAAEDSQAHLVNTPLLHQRSFPMANRIWQIATQPTAAFIANNTDRLYLWVPATGSLLTFVIVLYLFTTISQRRRAEQLVAARTLQLQEREQLFRLIFEKAGDGALLMDNNQFVDCNERALQMLGTTDRAYVIGKHPMEISPQYQPDGRLSSEKADEMIATAFQHGGQRFEWRHVRFSGEEFWADVQLTPIPWHGRQIFYIAWRDISRRKNSEQALRDSEQRFRALHEASSAGIVLHNQGIILECNQSLAEMNGYDMEQLIGMNCLELLAPAWRGLALQYIAEGYDKIYEVEGLRRDGSLYALEIRGKNISYQGRSVQVAEFRDISERHQAESRQRLAAAVFEAARESILVTDAQGHIVAVNPAFTAASGYTEAEVLGKNPSLLKADQQPDAYYATVWRAIVKEGTWQGEFWNRRRDGQFYLVLATISQVCNLAGDVVNYVSIATDITQQKAAEQQIEHLAYYDALTDLPNRMLLAQRAELALALAERHHTPMALLFLDLDRFKNVNDSLGHTEGDALLIQVAVRLKNVFRHSDTVCRLGGDEFVVLLPDIGPDEAPQLVEKVLAVFREPFIVAGHSLGITISIGVALYPQDGATFDELLKNADTALYRAKQEGRNIQVYYAPDMNVAAFERLLLESELRQAIDAGQLVAYFQPKICLSNGQLHGAEALVRWRHPERGLIPPGAFIPIAEHSGLIVMLGNWMLDAVCQQLAAWRATGLPALTIAVNLSARHFRDFGCVEYIQRLLTRYQLPASALELELTESTLLDASSRTTEILLALQQLGIGLSIDDFGTGYSSLSYLKRLPIAELKIDRSFVHDLVNDPDDLILAATIVKLGHSLGLRVVAEGVETEEQRQILLAQGCDLAQGYLFDPPIPAEQFTHWLMRDRLQSEHSAICGVS
jgi:diguanylate cyclase (GGDEF)-like protein/PAS domain S-box-containing protein